MENKTSELKNKTMNILQASKELLKKYGLEEKEKRNEQFIEKLKKGRTIVVVCGEFKRGKSSFINALIEEENICPVDIDITTNMATQIQYAEKPLARVFFKEESGKEPLDIEVNQVSKYVTEHENRRNSEMVKHVSLGLPKNILKENSMILIDTPGVGSLNVSHSQVTTLYLNYADVVLFISDANAPLTVAEIDFIKKAQKFCNQAIYFILTKIDMNGDWRTIAAENRKKISLALQVPPEEIKIFPVSNLDKLDYVRSGDKESFIDSKFDAVEEFLRKDLSRSIAQNIILKPLIACKNDVVDIKNSLSLQYKALQNENLEKRKEVEKNLAEINEKYKAIQKSNSKWQILFNDGSIDIRKKAKRIVSDGFNRLEKDIKVKLGEERFRTNGQLIQNFITDSILGIIKDVDIICNEELIGLQEKIVHQIGCEIDVEEMDFSNNADFGIQISNLTDQRTNLEKFRDFGRSVAVNTGAFGAGGAVVGGLIGGIFGVFAGGVGAIPAATLGAQAGATFGGIVGSFFGIKNSKKESEKKLEQDAFRVCIEIIQENRMNCYEAVDGEISNMLSSMKGNIISTIQESIETIENTRSEMNRNLSLNNEELKDKLVELQEEAKRVGGYELQINKVIAEVQNI